MEALVLGIAGGKGCVVERLQIRQGIAEYVAHGKPLVVLKGKRALCQSKRVFKRSQLFGFRPCLSGRGHIDFGTIGLNGNDAEPDGLARSRQRETQAVGEIGQLPAILIIKTEADGTCAAL